MAVQLSTAGQALANYGGGFGQINGADLAAIVGALNNSPTNNLVLITASGSVTPVAGTYFITATSAAAIVLPAPTAGTQDNMRMYFISTTAFAHTITSTGNFKTGSASVNVATFAAFAGASLELVAYQGKWYVASDNAITFS